MQTTSSTGGFEFGELFSRSSDSRYIPPAADEFIRRFKRFSVKTSQILIFRKTSPLFRIHTVFLSRHAPDNVMLSAEYHCGLGISVLPSPGPIENYWR